MCLYDRDRLAAATVDHAIATHSTVVLNGNLTANRSYELPAVAAKRSAQPKSVAWKIEELQRRS